MSLALPVTAAATSGGSSAHLTSAQVRNVQLTATRDKIKEAMANLENYPFGFVHGKLFAGSADAKTRKENEFLILQLTAISVALNETDLTPQLPVASRAGSVDLSCAGCKRSLAGKEIKTISRPPSASESRVAAVFCSACKALEEVHAGLNEREVSQQ